jgi:hypothetical protein
LSVNPFRVHGLKNNVVYPGRWLGLELVNTFGVSTPGFAQFVTVRYNPAIQTGQLERLEFVRSFKRHFRDPI